MQSEHLASDVFSITVGFASCAHRKQKRKYTGEPYIKHPLAVAQILAEWVLDREVIQAGILHDVLEDTDVTEEEMRQHFGHRVTNIVLQVTDVSKPEDGNRAVRKAIDRAHLAKAGYYGATVKLADMIDNTDSIVKHDPDFAKVYLQEKALILPLLRHSDQNIWNIANFTLNQAKEKLGYV